MHQQFIVFVLTCTGITCLTGFITWKLTAVFRNPLRPSSTPTWISTVTNYVFPAYCVICPIVIWARFGWIFGLKSAAFFACMFAVSFGLSRLNDECQLAIRKWGAGGVAVVVGSLTVFNTISIAIILAAYASGVFQIAG